MKDDAVKLLCLIYASEKSVSYLTVFFKMTTTEIIYMVNRLQNVGWQINVDKRGDHILLSLKCL